ncbi:hypothetical protein D3C71_1883560 [compost metagenome]
MLDLAGLRIRNVYTVHAVPVLVIHGERQVRAIWGPIEGVHLSRHGELSPLRGVVRVHEEQRAFRIPRTLQHG